jgi:GAF domain-containing protein
VGNVRFGADGDSPAGYALIHGEPVISRDLASETRFSIPDVLVKHDINSMVNVLIAGENGPFGVFEVDASRHRDFDDDDIAFLRNYANLLAAAIERHRSHRALEEATSRQKVLIQECRGANRRCPVDHHRQPHRSLHADECANYFAAAGYDAT